MKINLNKIYYVRKSDSCMNKNGQPLSVYDSYDEAMQSANYIGSDLVPYHCDNCNRYHLKPEKFYCEKIKRNCSCVDHNGKIKETYKTKEDALKMLAIRSEGGVKLYVYKCPNGIGYHLSSHNLI